LEDWAAYLIRLDAAKHLGQKKPKCKDGDECGGSCIEKGLRCNVKTGAAKTAAARALKGVRLSSAVTAPPSAYTAIEADERKLRLNAYETAIVYDAEGKELFRKKGDSSEVSFTAAECAKMKDAIVTHNHPALTALDAKYDRIYQGGSFSASDMIAAAGLDVAEIRAVGPEGTYRLVRPAKGWPTPEAVDRVYRQKSESEYGDALDQIRRGRKMIGDAEIGLWASTSEQTAKELGMEYSFTKSGVTKSDREVIDKATATGRKRFKSDMTSSVVRQWVEAGVAVSLVGVIVGGGGLLAREMSGKKAERPAEKKAPESSVVAPNLKGNPPSPIKAKPEGRDLKPQTPKAPTSKSQRSQEGDKNRDPSPVAAAGDGMNKVREFERKIRLELSEHSLAIREDGTQVVLKSGEEGHVAFTARQIRAMKDGILTHNHPPANSVTVGGHSPEAGYEGSTFSKSDIRMAVLADLLSIRAVAPEGVYQLTRPKEGWPPMAEVVQSFDALSESLYQEMLASYREDPKFSAQEATRRYSNGILEELSRKHGMGYSVDRTEITAGDKQIMDAAIRAKLAKEGKKRRRKSR